MHQLTAQLAIDKGLATAGVWKGRSCMSTWMAALAAHHAKMRRQHPADRLLIVFDIDGTLLDLRHMMFYLLTRYDKENGTDYFRHLRVTDIDMHEHVMDQFLRKLGLPEAACAQIESWYRERYWSTETINASHLAFDNALDMIRWFQLQPQTTVALNTGRLEMLRADTLASLNRMGEDYGIHFTDELLYMRPNDWVDGVSTRKVMGIQHVQTLGYRVIAFIDNEPNNLAAIAQSGLADEILLLHVDTIYLSPIEVLPATAVQGDNYTLHDLISEEQLPPALDLVWHGVNDRINLRQFLGSPIPWAELDVNLDPTGQRLILRHDTFAERAHSASETWLTLEEALAACVHHNKAVKLDFKVGGAWIEQTLALVEQAALPAARLWFNGDVRMLDARWTRQLAERYPGAVIQVPIGFLRRFVDQPGALQNELECLRAWGINRFSLNWQHAETRRMTKLLTDWGYEINLYGVTDLSSFLQAMLLSPRSLTCDFNFPAWGYYGRGSGYLGKYYEYVLKADE